MLVAPNGAVVHTGSALAAWGNARVNVVARSEAARTPTAPKRVGGGATAGAPPDGVAAALAPWGARGAAGVRAAATGPGEGLGSEGTASTSTGSAGAGSTSSVSPVSPCDAGSKTGAAGASPGYLARSEYAPAAWSPRLATTKTRRGGTPRADEARLEGTRPF